MERTVVREEKGGEGKERGEGIFVHCEIVVLHT